MADYYVDIASGNDLAAGSSVAPWRSLRRAIVHASASDVIYVAAADKTSAVRGLTTVNKSITIRPWTKTDNIFASPAYPIADGDIYEDLDREDYCQSYTGGTPATPTGWTRFVGTASSFDSSNHLIGAGCVLLDATSARQGIRLSVSHYNNKPSRFRIVYKCMDANSALRLVIRGSGDSFGFNTTSGTWVAGLQNNDYPASAVGTDWIELVTPWIDGRTETGNFVQIEGVSGGGRVLIQRIQREFQTVWTDYEGRKQTLYSRPSGIGVYAVSESQIPPSGDVVYYTGPWVQKCTVDEWTTSGTSALKIVPPAQNYASMTPGSYFYDHTATEGTLWYMPEIGEDFANIHIEACRGYYAFVLSDSPRLIKPRAFGGQGGYNLTGGSPVCYSPIEEQSTIKGFNCENATTALLIRPKSRQTELSTQIKQRGGGFFATGTSVLTIKGGDCYRTGDDSLQAAGAGSLIVHGFTSREPAGADCELINSSGTPSHTFYNVSGNRGLVEAVSFMDQSTGSAVVTVVMGNCAFRNILFQNSITRNYTIAAGVYSEAANAGASGGATVPDEISSNVNFSATLNYTSSTDLTPANGSDLLMTGVKWWGTSSRPTGGDGEPYPDFDLDVGGVQSTHGAFHPRNL